jgi:hypothetical protein
MSTAAWGILLSVGTVWVLQLIALVAYLTSQKNRGEAQAVLLFGDKSKGIPGVLPRIEDSIEHLKQALERDDTRLEDAIDRIEAEFKRTLERIGRNFDQFQRETIAAYNYFGTIASNQQIEIEVLKEWARNLDRSIGAQGKSQPRMPRLAPLPRAPHWIEPVTPASTVKERSTGVENTGRHAAINPPWTPERTSPHPPESDLPPPPPAPPRPKR